MPNSFNFMSLSPEFRWSLLDRISLCSAGSRVSYWAAFEECTIVFTLDPRVSGVDLTTKTWHLCNSEHIPWSQWFLHPGCGELSPPPAWALRIVRLTVPHNCSFWVLWRFTQHPSPADFYSAKDSRVLPCRCQSLSSGAPSHQFQPASPTQIPLTPICLFNSIRPLSSQWGRR